jgi:hypothetical protein
MNILPSRHQQRLLLGDKSQRTARLGAVHAVCPDQSEPDIGAEQIDLA